MTSPKLKRNPTYDATKPSAAEMRAVKNYIVDRIIRWAQGDEIREGYCDAVELGLTHVFGAAPKNGWRDSGGFDCYGFDVNERDKNGRDECGYDLTGYDEHGIHKDTRRTVDGYDRWGYNTEGWNKDGFNSSGQHRDGVDWVLSILTKEQSEELRSRLNAEKDAGHPSLVCDHNAQDS